MSRSWGFASASVIGTSHLKTPEDTCQDFNDCAYFESLDAFIGVVSDGAGSARRSATGSQLTCHVVMDECAGATLIDIYSRDFAVGVIEAVRNRISDVAAEEGLTIRDFACTLIVCVIGHDRAAFWQIGDGAICYRQIADERFRYAFWPAKGEYANVTEFVTDSNALSSLNFDTGPQVIGDIALLSDGLERLALDFTNMEVHTPFFNGLFPYLKRGPEGRLEDVQEQLHTFLGSDRVNKCTDDDKTLILASRD